jgi:hypothetical protein
MDKIFVVILLIGLLFLIMNGEEWTKEFRSSDQTVKMNGSLQKDESDVSLVKQRDKTDDNIHYFKDLSNHASREKSLELYEIALPETTNRYDVIFSSNVLKTINGHNHEVKGLNVLVYSENEKFGKNILTVSEARAYYSTIQSIEDSKVIQVQGKGTLTPYWRRLLTYSIYN